MVNINLDFAVAAAIHGQYQPRLCSGSYNTCSISTSTLQWQLQYMVNINLDLQRQQQFMVNINFNLQCAMSQQVYTRPKNNFSKIAANRLNSQWKEAMIGEKTERSDAPTFQKLRGRSAPTSQFLRGRSAPTFQKLEGRSVRPLSFWKVGRS